MAFEKILKPRTVTLVVTLLVTLLLTAALVPAATATTYEYDALHRLIRVAYDNGTVIEYVYDAVGNRIVKRITR